MATGASAMNIRMPIWVRHVVVIVALLVVLSGCRAKPERAVLRLYCGAGIRPPVAQMVDEFEEWAEPNPHQ